MNKQTLLAILLASTASFFWAANAIVGKIVVATLPAFTLSQFRWLLAFAIFPSIVSYFCWITAVNLSNATVAGLMITTAPLFNALLSLWVLNQAVSAMQWLGIVIVIIGVSTTLILSRTLTKSA